eukprot:TRINITY_DN4484_c0_g1_i2.p1 TRINITY_DN4484_c0_g1~~TRINITY_DN4484_c0_g1_i2.p1  ORF type:complete len:839 (-),score=105.02 TRINITY_DN4484_c0_g1_i2:64-2580(-)
MFYLCLLIFLSISNVYGQTISDVNGSYSISTCGSTLRILDSAILDSSIVCTDYSIITSVQTLPTPLPIFKVDLSNTSLWYNEPLLPGINTLYFGELTSLYNASDILYGIIYSKSDYNNNQSKFMYNYKILDVLTSLNHSYSFDPNSSYKIPPYGIALDSQSNQVYIRFPNESQTYNDSIFLTFVMRDTVILKLNNVHGAIIRDMVFTDCHQCLYLQSCSNISIINVTFANSAQAIYMDDCESISITDSRFSFHGMREFRSDFLDTTNKTVTPKSDQLSPLFYNENWWSSITTNGSFSVNIANNRFDNTIGGVELKYGYNTTIEANLINECVIKVLQWSDSSDTYIRGNIMTNLTDNPLVSKSSSSNVEFYENLIYSHPQYPIVLYSYFYFLYGGSSTIENLTITSNTFSGCHENSNCSFYKQDNNQLIKFQISLVKNIIFFNPKYTHNASYLDTYVSYRNLILTNSSFDFSSDVLSNSSSYGGGAGTSQGNTTNLCFNYYDPLLDPIFNAPENYRYRINPCMIERLERLAKNNYSFGNNMSIVGNIRDLWFGNDTFVGLTPYTALNYLGTDLKLFLNQNLDYIYLLITYPECSCQAIKYVSNAITSCDKILVTNCTLSSCKGDLRSLDIAIPSSVVNTVITLDNSKVDVQGNLTIVEGSGNTGINLSSTTLNIEGSLSLVNTSVVTIDYGSIINILNTVNFNGTLVANYSQSSVTELFGNTTNTIAHANITLINYKDKNGTFSQVTFVPPLPNQQMPTTTGMLSLEDDISYSIEYLSNTLVLSLTLNKQSAPTLTPSTPTPSTPVPTSKVASSSITHKEIHEMLRTFLLIMIIVHLIR